MLNLLSDIQGVEGGIGGGEVEEEWGSVTYARVLPGPQSLVACKADPFAAERPVIGIV